jgi:hypothetical protein
MRGKATLLPHNIVGKWGVRSTVTVTRPVSLIKGYVYRLLILFYVTVTE